MSVITWQSVAHGWISMSGGRHPAAEHMFASCASWSACIMLLQFLLFAEAMKDKSGASSPIPSAIPFASAAAYPQP